MKYGYIRPIVQDQQCTSQLHEYSLNYIYQEAHGLAKKRTELEALLMHLEKGDEIYVQTIPTLVDSLQHLIDLLRLAERDRITVHFIEEQLTNHTIQEVSILESATFFAQLQSAFLSHSSTFTLRAAQEKGRTIGRPRKSDDNLEKAFAMYDSKKYSLYEIKEVTGISKSTLYRYLDERSTDPHT